MINKIKLLLPAFIAFLKVISFRLLTKKQDLIFFCTSYVDEVWIRSTLKKCVEHNLQATLVVISYDKSLTQKLYKEYGDSVKILVINRGDAVRFINAKLIVTASSGLQKSFFNKSSKLIHMPHSLSSLHAIYPGGAFNGYDYLFSVGPYQDDEFKKLNGNQTFNVGYGKFDLIKDQKVKESKDKTILLAPSWHEGNFFDLVGSDLLKMLLENKYNVVLRPHPSHFISPNSHIQKAFNIYKDNSYFTLEDSTQGFDSFYKADLMISDFSGVAFEFAYSRLNPVLFIESKYKVLNKAWKDLKIEPFEFYARKECGVIAEPNISSISAALKKVTPSKKWRESIIDSRSKNIYNFNLCADNAYGIIEDLLNQ